MRPVPRCSAAALPIAMLVAGAMLVATTGAGCNSSPERTQNYLEIRDPHARWRTFTTQEIALNPHDQPHDVDIGGQYEGGQATTSAISFSVYPALREGPPRWPAIADFTIVALPPGKTFKDVFADTYSTLTASPGTETIADLPAGIQAGFVNGYGMEPFYYYFAEKSGYAFLITCPEATVQLTRTLLSDVVANFETHN